MRYNSQTKFRKVKITFHVILTECDAPKYIFCIPVHRNFVSLIEYHSVVGEFPAAGFLKLGHKICYLELSLLFS